MLLGLGVADVHYIHLPCIVTQPVRATAMASLQADVAGAGSLSGG